MNRVTSSLWVAAYLRRFNSQGIFAVVERRGAEQAGAIFIKLCLMDGTARLFAPAPQAFAAQDNDERRFIEAGAAGASEHDIDVKLGKEIRFDPDLWIVSVEDRAGRHFLDDLLIEQEQR